MADRYLRFKIECPPELTKKKDTEVYRKLEYMGPVQADGTVKKMYFRGSIKKPWGRYLDTNEFLANRDDNNKGMFVPVAEVNILEDMEKREYLKKYFVHIFI